VEEKDEFENLKTGSASQKNKAGPA